MEKHIFKFGESSLALIVPKKWADKHGLKPASRISVTEGNGGELVISAWESKRQEAERLISPALSASLVGRWVGLHYMYGTSKLRLHSDSGFSRAQLEAIEGKINSECPGFEITSQSNNDIVVDDFTDMKEVELSKVMVRIKSLIEQEFREIAEGDPKTVATIERRVNRFYMLGIRYANVIQPKDYAKYIGVLNMLELISDDMDALTQSATGSRDIFRMLDRQFGLCFAAFEGSGKAIEQVAALRTEIMKKVSNSRMKGLQAHLMEEITNSIANISEYGLRAEMAKGEEIRLDKAE